MRERLLKWLSGALGPKEDIQIAPEDEVWPEGGFVNAPDFDETAHEPICNVLVVVGEQVSAGQVLAELEMSMLIHEVVSPCGGIVKKAFVTDGDCFEPKQPLILLGKGNE